MNGIHDGLFAVVYVELLIFAADLLPNDDARVATRLRNALILGITLPAVLGFVHLLYGPLLIALASVGAVLGARKRREINARDPWLWLMFAALAIVAWEPLCRPLLEGDSLEYHLPNAASWVNAHSVWTTNADYWLYPPASELFAAGILAAAGRFALPLAGLLPALMLGARIVETARERGAPGYAGAAVALAFLTMPLAAFQIGTLQNDLWLAAFFVEALVASRGSVVFAVTALIKPVGWLLALIAAALQRRSWTTYAWIAIPLALWLVRDAILLPHALVTDTPPGWSTTIAAHLALAVPLFLRALVQTAPLLAVWLVLVFAGLFTEERRVAIAGLAVLALFTVLPVTFASGSETYLAWGTSLRYLLPAAAAGALVATRLAARAPVVAAIAGFALALIGSVRVDQVFANDALAAFAPWVMVIALVAAILPWKRPLALFVVGALAVIVGAHDAATRSAGFYADWMRTPAGKPTGAFDWLARNAPRRVVALNVRTGAVTMVTPQTWTLPVTASDVNVCERARGEHASLLIGSNESGDEAALAREFSSCGTTLYRDGAATIIAPSTRP